MSLETELKKNTAAIEALTAALGNIGNVTANVISTSPADAPVTQATASPATSQQTATGQMPPPPGFTPPAATTQPTTQPPFTDINGLMEYTGQVYQAVGAEKGAYIQNIIAGLGHSNINQITPDQFATYFQQLEQLKLVNHL